MAVKMSIDISKMLSEGKTLDEIMAEVNKQVTNMVKDHDEKNKADAAKKNVRDKLATALDEYLITCIDVPKNIVDTVFSHDSLIEFLLEIENDAKNITKKGGKASDLDSIMKFFDMF